MTRNTDTKVLVAMSGGVDSSVTAALLVEQGYQVVGAYMRQWRDTKDVHGVCQWKQERRDAMRVAAHLGIELITLDFEQEYKDWVMSYLFEEYKAGRTPNPDVMCNRYIKFGSWLDTVRELGYDFMATGHYARLRRETQNNKQQKIQNKNQFPISNFQLRMAKDSDKDQTYFLHQLNQEQLAHAMFPLGKYTKQEVRALAREYGLPTAEKEESMGICFVGEVPMKEFLQQKIKPTPGKIVTSGGDVIGTHEGLAFYTIGQRHLGSQKSKVKSQKSDQKPLYVLQKCFETNELVVGEKDDPLLFTTEIALRDMHWIAGEGSEKEFDCFVRFRHRQPLQSAHAVITGETHVTITSDEAQRAITPGQFAVLYKNGSCLGGGVITE